MMMKYPEFDSFSPPYSILLWLDFQQKGIADDLLRFRRYNVHSVAAYENVKIFDFHAEESIVLNLENYKDLSHYSPIINDFIIDSIAKGDFLVQANSFDEQQRKISCMIAAHTNRFPR